MKTPYQYWLDENETELRDSWSSMGSVEKHEEGGNFYAFCLSQFEQSDDVCKFCGHVPASGACIHCKMD
jgi:hypothetical protein